MNMLCKCRAHIATAKIFPIGLQHSAQGLSGNKLISMISLDEALPLRSFIEA